MAYRIEIKHSARKEMQTLPRRDQHRIIAAIEALAEKPRPAGVRKIIGADDLYRLRVGDYRVVYQVCDCKLIVLIIRIAYRKDIYRDL
jgi:mRNA interferase RelE/StbE